MDKPKLIQDLGTFLKDGTVRAQHYAIFECGICGNCFTAVISQVKSGNTKSCGCWKSKHLADRNFKHGMSGSSLYSVLVNMKARCYDESCKGFMNYGGRGIKVCDEWLQDNNLFFEWAIKSGYKKGLQIDRVNNDGDYCPGNCKWSTRFENCQNRRKKTTNTSGYTGVRETDHHKWRVNICVNKKNIHLGVFKFPRDAAIAYNNYVIENNTRHTLNVIED
jgi:hypothetical protein